mmetsp:Transcript_2434/g.7878  ORF Transcript_2434/g.7878 Transcript_2434/m.7878 type:complete len:246 (+) Transcript_2434:424-1161(+)
MPSNGSALPSEKTTRPSASIPARPSLRTAIRPSMQACTVPTSIMGGTPSVSRRRRGPFQCCGRPARAREPPYLIRAASLRTGSVNRSTGSSASQPNGSASSGLRCEWSSRCATCRWSRGTTTCGLRASRVGLAPCSTKSSAISEPLLPHPTTSTRLPFAQPRSVAFVYRDEWTILPQKRSLPWSGGRSASLYTPFAKITCRATKRLRDAPSSRATSTAHPPPAACEGAMPATSERYSTRSPRTER